MELEEIAQREEFILFDTSINMCDSIEDIIKKKRYSSSTKDIKNAQKDILKTINFINIDYKNTSLNISTISQVVTEINRLKTILYNHKKEFDEEKIFEKGKLKKISDRNQEKYTKLLNTVDLLISEVEKKKINSIKQDRYNLFYDSVSRLSEEYPHFCENKKNPYLSNVYKQLGIKDPETDQNIIATLFYLSIEEHKPYALITRDMGIFNLASKFHNFIYLDNSNISKSFTKKLYKNPIKIYIPYSHESYDYHKGLSSKKLYDSKRFLKDKKELDKLKREKNYKVIEIKPFQTSS